MKCYATIVWKLLLLLPVGYALVGCDAPQNYQGDGKFKDISGHRGPLYVHGYTISMPSFDLGAGQDAEYRLANLPSTRGCGIYLAIEPGPGSTIHDIEGIEETKNFEGFLRLELVESQGDAVTSVSGRLGDYWWALGGKAELYQLDDSFFTPDPNESYRLRLSYTPDERLNGLTGIVYLRSGGSK